MNAYLNIQVKVAAGQANQALKQIDRQLKGIGASGGMAAGGMGPLNRIMRGDQLLKFGKNLQWTGRQLEFNFTLPILLAAGAATKFALENEQAMTRVRMVYGGAGEDATVLKKEVDALGKSFQLLSSRFGVQQKQVIDIAQEWAEAGVAGRGLAEATKLTLEVMAVGGIDANKAVTGLMAIQTAYRLSTKQLRQEVALLAGINKTGTITFAGLIDVVQRAGSVARAAGIDIQHLAAMANVLTPAAGSAAQAGNAMRTMISRLTAPTKDTVDMMRMMGVEVNSTAFQAKNGFDKFVTLAGAFDKLSTSQKNLVSSVIASRWQINRFDILMEQINDHTSSFWRAISETEKPLRNNAIYAGMLTKALGSTPQGMKILTETMKNALSQAFVPMLPAMVGLLAKITQLVVWFSNLDPSIQQLVVGFLLVLAALGPVVRMIGAFTTLGGLFTKIVGYMGIAMSRKAAATVIDTAANEANAASIGHMEVMMARLNGMMRATVGFFWTLAKFPFTVVATLMGTMWRVATVGASLGVKGIGMFLRWLAQLPIVSRTVQSVMDTVALAAMYAWEAAAAVAGAAWEAFQFGLMLGWEALTAIAPLIPTAIGVAWITATEAITAAWVAFTNFLPVLWNTIPLMAATIGTAVSYAWTAAVEAAQAAWVAFTNFLPVLWNTLPLLAAAVGTGIEYAWIAASNAAQAAWAIFTEGVATLWRTLPLIAGAVGTAIQYAWVVAGNAIVAAWGVITGALATVWTAAASFFELVWVGAVIAVQTLWEALPAIAAAVGAMISSAWETASIVALYAWEFFTGGFVTLIVALPGIVATAATAIAGFLISPWGIALVAVVAFVAMFRKQIAAGVKSVIEWWNKMPGGIMAPLKAVVRIVAAAAKAAYEWLSYINPFAHHSPSLVEQVIKGVDLIARKYAGLKNIGTSFRQAISDLDAFKKATDAISGDSLTNDRNEIVKLDPSTAPTVDKLVASIRRLQGDLHAVGLEWMKQATVVSAAEDALNSMDVTVKAAEGQLDSLRKTADGLKNELDAAKAKMDALVNTPIQGMKAMSDAIFENEMAQKRLRLEILKLNQAGQSVDDLKNKMAALQGEIEGLRGDREDLRLAGAGSDVLGGIDQQINALKAQQDVIQNTTSPINDLQNQLDELQRQGEMLDLTNSLQFDPLTRQIDDLVNGMKEVPFDKLYNDIKNQQGVVDQLQTSWDAANKAVEQQQAVVDDLHSKRDALQLTYDTEKQKLDELSTAYDGIETQIRDMESAMQDFGSAVKAAHDASASGDLSQNQQAFLAGQDANFAIPGGDSTLGREGGLADIDKFNADMKKELDKTLKGLGKLDMFGPFKEMWNKGWDWVKTTIGPVISPIWQRVKEEASKVWNNLFDGVDTGNITSLSGLFDTIKSMWGNLGEMLQGTPLQGAFDNLSTALGTVKSTGEMMVDYFMKQVWPFLKEIGGWFVNAGKTIGDELKNWLPMFDPFLEAVGHVYTVISYIMGLVYDAIKIALGLILALWSLAWPILLNVLRPIFDAIVGVVRGALEIARGIISFVLALINGDWSAAWHAILTILDGIWDTIYSVLKGALGLVWGIIKGTFEGIINFFKTLWDLFLGPIFSGIKDKMGSVWGAIGGAIRAGVNVAIKAINFLIRGLNKVADILPGVNFHINEIQEVGSGGGGNGFGAGADGTVYSVGLARGGVIPTQVGGGFTTNGPRAIVGEGNALYPEFVVPTDPAHRQRAKALYDALGARLGVNAGRPPETGGFGLHNITDPIGTVAGAVGDVVGAIRKGAVTAAFAPFLALANPVINSIPWDVLKDTMNDVKNQIYNWVKGEDNKLPTDVAGDEAVAGSGWQAIRDWLQGKVPFRVTSTLRSGDTGSYHALGRAVDFAGPTPGRDTPALLAINRALLPIAGTLKELIYAGPGGASFKNGSPNSYSEAVRADHHDHVHAALATGGIVTQPTKALIGEAGSEAVVPLREFYNHLDEGFNSVVNRLVINDFNNALLWGDWENLDLTRRTLDNTTLTNALNAGLSTLDESIKGLPIGAITTKLDSVVSAINSTSSSVTNGLQDVESAIQDLARSIESSSSSTSNSTSSGGGGGNGGDAFHDYYVSQPQGVQQYLWAVGHPGGQPYPGYETYDTGGILSPGLTIARNLTGENEYVLTRAQLQSLQTKAVASGMTLDRATAAGSGGDRIVNINGNLEFPNITSGTDAEDLIRNLEALADD